MKGNERTLLAGQIHLLTFTPLLRPTLDAAVMSTFLLSVNGKERRLDADPN